MRWRKCRKDFYGLDVVDHTGMLMRATKSRFVIVDRADPAR